MKNTKIEWTHHTVNLWIGCSKVSEACENCYAEAWAKRFHKDCFGRNPRMFRFDKAVAEIEKLNRSAQKRGVVETVFINSMSDFFDGRVLTEFRLMFWESARRANNLVFLILTKRASVAWHHFLQWTADIPDNVQFGITAENQRRLDERMKALKSFKGKVFLSCEPLLESIDITPYADRIDWVICGGESGSGSRMFTHLSAMSLFNQCKGRIPFFFKQAGKNNNMCPECIGEWEQIRRYPAWHPSGKATK